MNSDLQNKMYHFEADPPPEVWNKIADALDEEETYPQRLFSYEEQPPAQVWKNIEAVLEDSTAPAIKIVPFTRYKKPVRYLAAAASILAVVLFTITFDNKKTGAGSVIGGAETVVTTNQSSIVPLDIPNTEKGQAPPADVVITQSDKEDNITRQTDQKRTASSIRPQTIFRSFSFSQKFIPKSINKEALFDFSSSDNYMVYSDGAGNAMKLPKKLFSLVHCEDGDASCKERIHQLQQKLAAGAATTDFVGILEILRQLQ